MAEPPFRPPRTEVVSVADDQLLAVVLDGDGVAVPIRLLCDNLGLSDAQAQVTALREHPVYSAGMRMVNVRVGNRVQSVAALLHTYIPAWLNSISPNRVNAATRPKLIRYQTEIVDILAQIYLGLSTPAQVMSSDPTVLALQQQQQALYTELRALREQLRSTQQQSDVQSQQLADVTEIVAELQDVIAIGPKEAAYIQAAIKRIAQRATQRKTMQTGRQSEENLYQLIFGQFKAAFAIPRYDALPRRRYNDALAWLTTRAAELLPDDADALPPHQERLI